MSQRETPTTVAPRVQAEGNEAPARPALQGEREPNNANELTRAELEAQLKADPDVQKSAKTYMYGRVERRDGIQFFTKRLTTLAADSTNKLRKNANTAKISNLDCYVAASKMTGASEVTAPAVSKCSLKMTRACVASSVPVSKWSLFALSAMKYKPFSGAFDRTFPLTEDSRARVRTPRVVRSALTTMYEPPKIPVRQTSTSLIRRALHKRFAAEKKRRSVNKKVVPSEDRELADFKLKNVPT